MKIRVGTGSLTASNTQLMASFAVYANNTVWFNVTSFELAQAVYQYTVQSFGNGTLTLRFRGIQPFQITGSSLASQSYSSGSVWEQLTYTTSQTSALLVVYTGPKLASAYLFGVVTLLGVLMAIVGIIASYRMTTVQDPKKRAKIVLMVIGFGVMAVAVAIIALVVGGL